MSGTAHVVTGAVAILRDGTGAAEYYYTGAILPSTISVRDLERCIERGLVAAIDVDGEHVEEVPGGDGDPGPAAEPNGGGDPAAAQRPKKTAGTDAWREYRVAQGVVPAEEAAGMTREQLISLDE